MENKMITIYELMGLIKDDKAPNKVSYKGSEYKFCNDIGDYRRLGWEHCLIMKDIFTFDSYSHNSLYNMLNDKVEILSEENDEWEDIEEFKITGSNVKIKIGDNETFLPTESLIIDYVLAKENQLIKNQKYLKEKIEKYDRED